MFGYVVVDKPNILIKDYQTYRAYYCGVCKAIGKECGTLMRLTLNYDVVLLALLGHNYEHKEPVFATGHCIAHPVGRKIEYVDDNEILRKVADINVVLGYYKVYDDVVDEGKHRAILSSVRPYYKRAKKRVPDFDVAVRTGYEKLRRLEKTEESLSRLADAFGYMLSAAGDAVSDKCDKRLREFLFHIGRWIYCIDAFDDLQKDYLHNKKHPKKKNYNPFLRGVTDLDDTVKQEVAKTARVFLYDCVSRAVECYEKMTVEVSEGPLSNIVYRGLKSRTEFVLNGRGEEWQTKIRL
ncbi:MAG: hypothetical protein IJ735_06490 [Clostridia bacterium]|nr:hypothetical protein [Clostridia bacterium]